MTRADKELRSYAVEGHYENGMIEAQHSRSE